jgi:hypothetical protein
MAQRYFTALSSWQLCCVGPKYQSPHFEQPETVRQKASRKTTRATTLMKRLH